MYETYPSKNHHHQFGSITNVHPKEANGGMHYAAKQLPCTEDDRRMSKIKQHGCACSAPGDTYPKGAPGHSKFGSVEGLPS